MPDTTTIRDLLQSAKGRLRDADTAQLDCEVLLATVIKRDRNYLYTHPEAVVTRSEIADFNSLISKRADGYPVAYLTGWKEFWSIPLSVDRNTLIPRPETELLIETALEFIDKDANLNVLDLGTGSGAIAIALARERPLCPITASDISMNALSLAMANARSNNLPNIRFLKSDWFSELDPQRYDIILSNPPYVESGDPGFNNSEIRYEPRIALDGGAGGMDAYFRIIPAAARHLSGRGRLLVEHGHTQGGPVRQLFRDCHYLDITTRKDYAGHERLTFARYPG